MLYYSPYASQASGVLFSGGRDSDWAVVGVGDVGWVCAQVLFSKYVRRSEYADDCYNEFYTANSK